MKIMIVGGHAKAHFLTKALKENGYDGVLCVELDNPEICNFRSAQISRQYIKDVLKL